MSDTRIDQILADMDDVLLAFTDGRQVAWNALSSLPPWRAVLLARVLLKAGVVDEADVAALVSEAASVGGDGQLQHRHNPPTAESLGLPLHPCRSICRPS